METNKLYLNKFQFDTLISLPAVRERYTFYKKQFTDVVDDVEIATYNKRWIKFAGVEFIEMHDA